MKNRSKTLSIFQCLVMVCVMSGVIHAQTIVVNNNGQFTVLQQVIVPQQQTQSFGYPTNYQMFNENADFIQPQYNIPLEDQIVRDCVNIFVQGLVNKIFD